VAKAGSYALLAHIEMWRPEERTARITAAAEGALRVDSTLAEAYALLSSIHVLHNWDFFAAEHNYETALRLDSTDATVHLWYAQFLSIVRRDDDAISHIRRAQELDPIDPFIAANVAFTYYFGRRYDEAEAEALKALELDSGHWVTHWNIGLVRSARGDYDAAVAELELAMELAGGGFEPLPGLGFAYARAGRRAEAEEVLRQLEDMAETDYVAASYFASVYAGLDEYDLAFQWLERAYQERDFYLVWMLPFHRWDSLRPDPRFRELERRIGLTDYIAAQNSG
jgi:Flp pilus assembly protein TadD